MIWQHDDPRWMWLERGFAYLITCFFLACVLSWRGVDVFGDGPPFQPLRLVFLSGALCLQTISGLFARKRMYLVSFPMLALSLVGIWLSLTTHR